jgi:hypothetical protein
MAIASHRQPQEKVMLPATFHRVARNTSPRVNDRIEQKAARRIRHYAAHPAEIEYRLADLEREWDVERALTAHSAAVVLTGLALGVLVDRRYLLLSALSATLLMQHALKGWCLPLPLIRRLGVRTAAEIDYERYALKALRGDFQDIPQAGAWQPGVQQAGEVEPGTPMAAAQRDRASAALDAVRR